MVGREGLEPSVYQCQRFTVSCVRRYATCRWWRENIKEHLLPLLLLVLYLGFEPRLTSS